MRPVRIINKIPSLRRWQSSVQKLTVTEILLDLNLIQERKDVSIPVSTQVETFYKELLKEPTGTRFEVRLVDQLKLLNSIRDYRFFFQLLNKINSIESTVPGIEVYNQIFRSLLLMSNKSTASALPSFAIRLADECILNGVELNDRSFYYLDKIVARSKFIQVQLRYEQILSQYGYFSLSYLLLTGQYERAVDRFNEIRSHDKSDQCLLDLKIFDLLHASLERLDYKQAIELCEIVKDSGLIMKNETWYKFVELASSDGNEELTLYLYENFLKNNVFNFTKSTLLRVCQVLAQLGHSQIVLSLMDSIKLAFKEPLTPNMLSLILESYCVSLGYKYAWGVLNRFTASGTVLQKQDFDNLMDHYPEMRKFNVIDSVMDDVAKLDLNDQLKEIIYYTIFKKTHNDTNLTGVCRILSNLQKNNDSRIIFDNFDTVLHSISRSNASKIFTYQFHEILQNRSIKLSSKHYEFLMTNLEFSRAGSDNSLLNYLVQHQLQKGLLLSPSQLKIISNIGDAQLKIFCKDYSLNNGQIPHLKVDSRVLLEPTKPFQNYLERADYQNVLAIRDL